MSKALEYANDLELSAATGMLLSGMSNIAAELRRLDSINADLLDILTRILRCHDSGNNGAYMGEAVLCPMFADLARAAISKATGETR